MKIPKEKQNVAPREPLLVRRMRWALQQAEKWNNNDIAAYEDCAPTMDMLDARKSILKNALKATK